MRLRLQIALLVAAVLYMGWGLGLLLAPAAAQTLMSAYANDPVMSRLFGASLIAWTIAFCIGARHPEREIVHACIVACTVVSLIVAYAMFVAESMPRVAPTVISLGLNSALALFLFSTRLAISYREWRGEAAPAAARPGARKAGAGGRAVERAVERAAERAAQQTREPAVPESRSAERSAEAGAAEGTAAPAVKKKKAPARKKKVARKAPDKPETPATGA